MIIIKAESKLWMTQAIAAGRHEAVLDYVLAWHGAFCMSDWSFVFQTIPLDITTIKAHLGKYYKLNKYIEKYIALNEEAAVKIPFDISYSAGSLLGTIYNIRENFYKRHNIKPT